MAYWNKKYKPFWQGRCYVFSFPRYLMQTLGVKSGDTVYVKLTPEGVLVTKSPEEGEFETTVRPIGAMRKENYNYLQYGFRIPREIESEVLGKEYVIELLEKSGNNFKLLYRRVRDT